MSRIKVKGGYAVMADGYEMVDGHVQISGDVYTDGGVYLVTTGWNIDPTEYHQNGIPSSVTESIQAIVEENN